MTDANEQWMQFRRKHETEVLPFYNGGRFDEFAGVGGIKIRFAAFEKKDGRGALVVLPGKSETYLKYAEVFYDLSDLPLSLYAMDHRGMGFSERMLEDRLKTHVESFEHYVQDVRTFLDSVVGAAGHRHPFVLGHSTGALIAARTLEDHPETFRAAVLCSPLFELPMGPLPGFLAAAVAGLLDRLGGGREYGPGQKDLKRPAFAHNKITHDYPRWSLWEQEIIPGTEPIRFGGVTRRWLRESLAAGQRALRRAGQIEAPLLLLQAGQDGIVRLSAQDRFCRRARNCTRLRLPEARHEILIEQDQVRGSAIERIKSFLLEQLG
jgi:lysophospholipase